MKKILLIGLIICSTIFYSCKKTNDENPQPKSNVTDTVSVNPNDTVARKISCRFHNCGQKILFIFKKGNNELLNPTHNVFWHNPLCDDTLNVYKGDKVIVVISRPSSSVNILINGIDKTPNYDQYTLTTADSIQKIYTLMID